MTHQPKPQTAELSQHPSTGFFLPKPKPNPHPPPPHPTPPNNNTHKGGKKGRQEGAESRRKKIKKGGKHMPILKKRWLLRKNIFYSPGVADGQTCNVVTGWGSSDNIISQTLTDNLQLKVCKHYHPLFCPLVSDRQRSPSTTYPCQVTSAISKDYKDTMWCGIPWMVEIFYLEDRGRTTRMNSWNAGQYIHVYSRWKGCHTPSY